MTDGILKEAEARGVILKLWFPHDVTFDNATYSLKMRAPEFANSQREGRNQVVKQTRAGYSVAYDRGRDLDQLHTFRFTRMTESERANLVSFLSAVNWGASKVAIEDWNDITRVIRLTSTNLDQVEQNKFILEGGEDQVAWDFSFSFSDITDNIEELGIEDNPNMSNALVMHVQDNNMPHNPPAITSAVGVGTTVIAQQNIETVVPPPFTETQYINKSVMFIVSISSVSSPTIRGNAIVTATTDRDYAGPGAATAIKAEDISLRQDGVEISTDVTLGCVIGTDTSGAQTIDLQATVGANSYDFQVRKFQF